MERLHLKTGRDVLIRPIQLDDAARLRAGYDRLSSRSKYQRFLAAKPHLSSTDTQYLVDVDGSNHVALVAVDCAAPREILAVARFVRYEQGGPGAELAVVVADHAQREGLGRALLVRLLAKASELGITRLGATMLTENRAAQQLMHSLPAPVVDVRHKGATEELELALGA